MRILTSFVLAVSALLLGACASLDPLSPASRATAGTQVTAALTEAMPDLYAKATTGRPMDKLVYGLAVMAGRDTTPLDDATIHAANIARAEAQQADDYMHRQPLGDAPPASDVARWAEETLSQLSACLPCRPVYTGDIPPANDTDKAYLAFTQMNDPIRWIGEGASAMTPAMTTFIYMPPTKKGGAGYTMPLFIPASPIIQPYIVADARQCVSNVAVSLKIDAALAWLATDQATAAGQRLLLEQALAGRLTAARATMTGATCADGSFENLRGTLRAHRPDLDSQAGDFVARRVGDPRLIMPPSAG